MAKLKRKPKSFRIPKRLTKPAFNVPTMKQISDLDWNGFNAVSTFSGCGGSSTGYRMAGFKMLWANEFIEAARNSYKANMATHTVLDGRDVREVTGQDILDAIGLDVGEIDLFDGSPPCASFSTAGKREKAWGKVKSYSDTTQRADDLFFEFARLIRETQPKTFVAENVSGLVKGTAKGYFLMILQELKSCGYRVRAKLLSAQWLGVPQARQRLIFIGVRDDLQLEPVFPSPQPHQYSVADACPHIIKQRYGGSVDNWQSAHKPAATIVASDHSTSPTAYLSSGGWVIDEKSSKPRKYTIEELRRICAFPDDFALEGTYQQKWERLGRSVPPTMMMHIAATVRDKVLRACRA